MNIPSLRTRLDELKHKKTQAQKANHADAHKYKSIPIASDEQSLVDDDDKMNWSAQKWEAYSGNSRAAPASGFKNQSNLAHATYLKELSKMAPDLDKYKKNSALGTDPSKFTASKEDTEMMAQRLREASDRKQSRRTGNAEGGQYITEKNRQFNMKLDREYGSSG